jgi:uncharacterized protein YkwD
MGCRPCCMDKRDTNITVNFDNMANDSNSPINIKNDSISSFQGNNTSRSNNDNVALNEESIKLYQNNYKYYYDILEKINFYRIKHNVNPLIINNEINLLAQKHSDKIARENFIELSNNKYEGIELGEIIFSFNEKYSPENIIISFYEEESSKYNYKNKKPKPSNFTQIIWKNTKYIGIGCTKTKNNNIFAVIEFYPPGNITNQFLSNVFPPKEEDEQSSNSDIKIHFLEDLLNITNEYRAKHKVQKLKLNPYLTTKANEYAKLIAENNVIMNIDIEYLGEKCGKNICVQNYMNQNGKDILDEWYNERKDYNFFNVKKNDKEKVKNFSQLIWKDTKEVGFGWAQSNNGTFYVVGVFFPCGNVKGKYLDNVFPEEE